MGVEAANFINELDKTFPLSGDPVSKGDDHLRLLKSVLQNQFPNLTASALNATVAEFNSIVGVTSGIQSQLDLKSPIAAPSFTGIADFAGQVRWSKGSDVASATSLNLGADGNMFDITGTIDITSINTEGVGSLVILYFVEILTLTHDAINLILPSMENIVTAAGDIAIFYEYATGDWRCISYQRADGNSLTVQVGQTVQVVHVHDGDFATGTALMTRDDNIPQNTEGTEFMSLAITPTNANNKLKIEVVAFLTHNTTASACLGALFQDSAADAIAAANAGRSQATNGPSNIAFTHYMTAGTVISTTFKFRAGHESAGNTGFNGANAARIFGGVMASSITITEIKV